MLYCYTSGIIKILGKSLLYLLSRDDRRIDDEGEVNPWVGHQVGLELVQIDIQGAVEPQGSSDGRDDLTDQPNQTLNMSY